MKRNNSHLDLESEISKKVEKQKKNNSACRIYRAHQKEKLKQLDQTAKELEVTKKNLQEKFLTLNQELKPYRDALLALDSLGHTIFLTIQIPVLVLLQTGSKDSSNENPETVNDWDTEEDKRASLSPSL